VFGSDDATATALPVIEALRAAGVDIVMHSGGGSFKSQLKKADASGARFALIFGDDEVAQGMVTVKALRDGAGAQVQHPLAHASEWAGLFKAQ
jgi:histidyl-tRNA synthetase